MDSDDEREHDGKDRIESVSFGDKKKRRGDTSMIEYGMTNRAGSDYVRTFLVHPTSGLKKFLKIVRKGLRNV